MAKVAFLPLGIDKNQESPYKFNQLKKAIRTLAPTESSLRRLERCRGNVAIRIRTFSLVHQKSDRRLMLPTSR